jgi:vancomycin permeability regulator SanA
MPAKSPPIPPSAPNPREVFSRIRAVIDVELLHSEPRHYGEKIPLWKKNETKRRRMTYTAFMLLALD